MSPTLTALAAAHPGDVLQAAVAELRTSLPFHGMQLLRHDPRRADIGEVLRVGYSPNTAWALRHLFVEKYRVGFTQTLSPNDGLPPAISSVRPEFRDDFVASRIFQDHLQRQGYLDGISMELFLRGEYVGIAHFSSRDPLGFPEESRRAAASVRGLLAALIFEHPMRDPPHGPLEIQVSPSGLPREHPVHTEPIWHVLSRAQDHSRYGEATHPIIAGRRFITHVAQFRRSDLTTAQHLWCEERDLVRIELRKLPHGDEVAVGISSADPRAHFQLSLQELRVVTFLCTGLEDAAIADRLHVSRRTVESHVMNARRKLGARNRVEAVVRAITTASTLPDPEHCPIHRVLGQR